MRGKRQIIERRALRIDQNKKHPLYLFSLTGEELFSIADISRVSRSKAGKLIGYQRPEVKRHIAEIVEYLNTEEIIFPNSLILALSSKVRFRSSRGPKTSDGLATGGTLEIPLPGKGEKKPAWIVDGQQRAFAISRSNRLDWPMPINAFLADEISVQRDQFLRVNNTKPLPRGLITELLPEVSDPLPARIAARRIPSALCDVLNRDPKSPLYGLIRRASSSEEERRAAVVADLSVVKMIEESINSPSGCLFPYRNVATGETDSTSIVTLLISYWNAVKNTFPDAWGKPPARSRLMHGAGVRAMGRLMDRIMGPVRPSDRGLVEYAERELKTVAPHCQWTSGKWEDLGGLRWNEIQNVPRHIRLLSSYLIRLYVGSAART